MIALAPFDMETLEHFIFLERPADAPVHDSASFDDAAGYRRGERAGSQLMPSACDYETIAEFYEHIRSTISGLSWKLGEENLFSGPPEAQLGPDAIRLEGLTAITSLASALTAIDQIVLQGEGSTSDNTDSHFARFSAIKVAFEAKLASQPDFRPAHPAARNPVMKQPVDELQDRVHVNGSHAAALLDLANALYNQMLRMLTQLADGMSLVSGRGNDFEKGIARMRRQAQVFTG